MFASLPNPIVRTLQVRLRAKQRPSGALSPGPGPREGSYRRRCVTVAREAVSIVNRRKRANFRRCWQCPVSSKCGFISSGAQTLTPEAP